jgi:hypothetical protein
MQRLHLARPPGWGIVILVVLFLATAGIYGYLALRGPGSETVVDSSSATRGDEVGGSSAASTTAPRVPAAATPSAVSSVRNVLAVYGDGYSSGSVAGGVGAAGWPALVAAQLQMDLRLAAVAQSGYVAKGVTGQTFGDVIAAKPVPDAAVTVVFGSRNDDGVTDAQVGAASAAALRAVRAAAPDTALLVIGPIWTGGGVPAELYDIRDAVRASAESVGATFVDPLAEGWLDKSDEAVAADGISATDTGHAVLAKVIADHVQTLSTTAPSTE